VRRPILLVLFVLAGVAFATPAAVAEGWHSEQPESTGLGAPTALGPVGDVEFWAPNRGMLITAGNGGSPAGLYAYDGTGWYRYSTVCGGHEGRIAWAGPDEFWTISDQPVGQETGKAPPQHISLCHFQNGQVVASYAEPVGVAESYLPLNAAACAAPDDCWFAGDRLPGTTNVGAFHLHWDGTTLSVVPSLTNPQPEIVDPARSVESLAFHQGGLYESVAVREDDEPTLEEEASQPSLLHRIVEGAPSPFEPLSTKEPIFYGAGAEPTQLEAFRLTGDDDGLWAIAGAESAPATVTALRLGPEGFEQVVLEDPGAVFGPGDRILGAAAEPGSDDAWVGFRESGDPINAPARLTVIHADGTVDPPTDLPTEGEGIGRKGPAGPIACPGAGQCWMATGKGWLFHLGPALSQDTDPAMHVLVSFRPPDDSLPSVPPISLPEDTSGAEPPAEELSPIVEDPLPRRPRPLYSKLHQRVIGNSLLEMTFVLHAKAHVRLVARRKGHIVAETPRYTMAKGPRSLRLRLDPKRWPSKLELNAHAVGKKGASR
jgi:hypothetical protein